MNKRSDASLIKNQDPFHSVVPYIMPKRTEAEVSITESFDVTELNKYMSRRNADEGLNLKLFHAVCTAVARTIYLRPKMNIFIAGRCYWQRNNISLSFVAKKKLEDSSEEVLMFIKADPEMNIDKVSSIITGDVSKAREKNGNDLDKTMKFVGNLPRFALEILFWILKRFEYHGIMPVSLMKGDPNYSTVLLSNLGSIGAGAPYHHLSNYGTCSIMITIGTMHREYVRNASGEEERDKVDITFILDERIADGFYFAKSLRITHYLLEHPEALAESLSNPVPVEL